ncbi:MAG TPA: hypothetical protein EYG35_01005 [Gammaproteobacteria bacterium]|jgi:hypothetical protein|nr:hypothetical protein [Gammaproteobacteria bacterium]
MKDPVNINKNGIDDEILVFLYRNILLFYERFLKAKGSGYSVRSKIFKKVKKEFELHWFVVDTIGAFKCAYTEKNLSEMKGNYFLFTSNRAQIPELFRHLRNSIAHGKFEKKKIQGRVFIIFEDSYQKQSTMCGQIELKKLEEFVSLLYKSKKIIKRKKKE